MNTWSSLSFPFHLILPVSALLCGFQPLFLLLLHNNPAFPSSCILTKCCVSPCSVHPFPCCPGSPLANLCQGANFFFTEIRIVQPDLFWFQHYTHFTINCMQAFGNTLARDFKNDSLLHDPNGSVKIKM